MEIGGREVVEALCRIAVLPVAEIPFDDAREAGVRKEITGEAIECGGAARDPGREENPARPQDARELRRRAASTSRGAASRR